MTEGSVPCQALRAWAGLAGQRPASKLAGSESSWNSSILGVLPGCGVPSFPGRAQNLGPAGKEGTPQPGAGQRKLASGPPKGVI
eukprot:NODE_7854_length_544_cov_7.385859_g6817_i0.p2 GENE.NODE_7854_length_544_cov_7.385859_g6817_i0~~NODE_7854_length_544_cov_7.385859_g6817_i0.p2  ORF type:complete len:84 (+),score=0.03 NODE_7854_length_544_cov_7.385859_g6817_i0:156-407(+)